jgi:hypothetical protein
LIQLIRSIGDEDKAELFRQIKKDLKLIKEIDYSVYNSEFNKYLIKNIISKEILI